MSIIKLLSFILFNLFIVHGSVVFLLFITCNVVFSMEVVRDENDRIIEYGVDVSFPMHHESIQEESSPLHRRQEFYDNFLQGCVDYFGKEGSACLESEQVRIDMSLRQPQSMRNYTEIGFQKTRTPEHLFHKISHFWGKNQDRQSIEEWETGESIVNHWEAPTYLLSFEDKKLRGHADQIQHMIWDETKDALQQWTDQELKPCSLYGIRVYKTDSILAPHVERMPSVISAIINVASDLDEPWPLEFIGHDGKAANVTMEPGDMVLYESHSVLHGNPFPLKGRYVANIFVHFEPTGHSIHNAQPDIHYENGLPPYILPGTPEAEKLLGIPHDLDETNDEEHGTLMHGAADRGDLDEIKRLFKKGHPIDIEDKNGWTPLLEASRGGHMEVVKFLIEHGADVNKETVKGDRPLQMAQRIHGEDHPIVELLIDAGAIEFGPEL